MVDHKDLSVLISQDVGLRLVEPHNCGARTNAMKRYASASNFLLGIIPLILVALLIGASAALLSLAGGSRGDSPGTQTPSLYLPLTLNQYPATSEPTATPTQTPTPTATPTPSGTPSPNYIVFNRGLDLNQVIDSIQVSTGSSIWIVDPANPTGTLSRVTPNESASSLMPSWGPEKSRIVFASNRGNAGSTPLLDIWTVGPDGSNLQRLTGNAGHNWTPAWSPDGNTIAFASTRNAPGGDVDSVWTLDVFIMNADGSNQRLLADLGGQDEDPVFSADSQTVYFMAEQAGCYQLWQVPAGGGSAGPLLDDQGNPICGEDPSLSPDGGTLFFWDNQAGRFAGVNLSTGQVTGYAWGSLEPWIGPDGARFTYIQDGNVYTANLDGSAATAITQMGSDFFPRWAAPAGARQ